MSTRTVPQVGTSIAVVATSRIISALMQAASLLLVARNIPTNTFGLFAATLTVVLFVAVVAEAGLDTYCSRSIARGQLSDAALSNGLHLTLALSAGFVTTCLLAVGVGVWQLPIALTALPIYVVAERRLSFRLTNLIALQNSSAGVLPLALGRTATLAALAALIATSSISPLLLFALTGLLGTLLSLAFLRRRPFVGLHIPAFAKARLLLAGGRPFWIATLSGQIRSLDVAFVAALGSPVAAALYALPARAVAPMRLVGTSVAAVAFPLASRGEVKALRRLNQRVFALAAVGIVATAFVWSWVPDLAALAAGERYRVSGEVLRVFMIGVALNVVGSLMSSELQGFGDSRFVGRMGMALVVVFYIALGVGLWAGGAQGAAWGTTVAFASQLAIVAWRLRWKAYLK